MDLLSNFETTNLLYAGHGLICSGTGRLIRGIARKAGAPQRQSDSAEIRHAGKRADRNKARADIIVM
jgi:hypothetical protein